jgi:LmbE family N-acetylglucosaminyl deacetylase
MKKMLLVFAHPDDESFWAGGTAAKYVKAGWDVDLIYATRGEKGKLGVYENVNEEKLGDIRQKEAVKAGTLLGISTITFLGYKDGTLAQEIPGEIEDKIYQKMTELVPDCVITFNTTGINNHPDHVKTCYATTFAFQKYASWIKEKLGDRPDFTENLEPKLYYACIPESVVTYLQKNKIFPEESHGKPLHGTDDKFITTVIQIRGFENTKKKALRTHISQKKDIDRILSFARNPLVHQEWFILRLHGIREVFMGKGDRVTDRL